jgi:hypothetical protein
MKKETRHGFYTLAACLLLIVATGGCSGDNPSLHVTKAEEKQFFAHPTSQQVAQMNQMRAEAQAKTQAAAEAATAAERGNAGSK